MKKFFCIIAATAFTSGAVIADPAPNAKADKLAPSATIFDCLNILAGLQEIDGKHPVIVNAGKPNEAVIEMPYEFGNPRLRQDIGHDIAVLSDIQRSEQGVQQKILMEVSKGSGEIRDPGDKASQEDRQKYQQQSVEYNLQMRELTGGACDISGLNHIRISDLKLDKNEIRGAALAAIDKILDK